MSHCMLCMKYREFVTLLLFPRRREREAQQRERDEAEAELVSGRRVVGGGERGREARRERERGREGGEGEITQYLQYVHVFPM